MKKILLASATCLLVSAGAAGATDLPIKAPAYRAPVAVPLGWSGFYIGAHAGYGWGDFDRQTGPDAALPVAHPKPDGGFGGFQFGWNSMLTPNWLLGTEADFSFGSIKDNALDPSGNNVEGKINAFGTARTRLGYVFDNRSLLYVTGGVAWAHNRVNLSGPAGPETVGEYHVGWAVGGGWEYAFDPRWSMKIEYLYSDLGKWRERTSFTTNDGTRGDLTLSTVKIGFNYRLGEGAAPSVMPVKAAYAPVSIWNGSYIGAHAGYGWSDVDAADTIVAVDRGASLSPSGWLGGIQTGYNWQLSPNIVFGFESDNSFMSMKDSGQTSPDVVNARAKIEDFGTVRIRYGYLFDNTALLYATGGLAYARVKYAESGPGIDAFSTKYYNLGWTVGAGVEYAFAPRWSTKLEYLYADLGKTTDDFGAVGVMRTDVKVQTVKVGVNYKFQWSDLFGR
jgi:outer membrane immunogenic protein